MRTCSFNCRNNKLNCFIKQLMIKRFQSQAYSLFFHFFISFQEGPLWPFILICDFDMFTRDYTSIFTFTHDNSIGWSEFAHTTNHMYFEFFQTIFINSIETWNISISVSVHMSAHNQAKVLVLVPWQCWYSEKIVIWEYDISAHESVRSRECVSVRISTCIFS